METTPSESINNTVFHRLFTLVAIKLLKRHRPRNGNVLFLSRKLCVKYGSFQHLSEAATMQFIARHTSIPVPKVHCAFTYKGWTYILMERIAGEILSREWPKRTEESQAKILLQLKEMVNEMRALPPPDNMGISNVDGGSLFDSRLPGSSVRFGPFRTIQEFHRHLRGGLEGHPDHFPEIRSLITQHEGPWPAPCFTHADLSSLNILVCGDSVVGIIDWETAGWYPTYWEYATAYNVNPRNEFWREQVDKFLEPMPEELDMEKIRLKYFGDT